MDSSKPGQQSSLESLRTVEFRQTLRGYHIDDVDEYLERVAVDAELLQDHYRQSTERLRQAAERISQLERLLAETRQREQQAPPREQERVGDETLQRTLMLAQRFVDQTKADAEANARATVAKAEEQARSIVSAAENNARSAGADTERRLREEVEHLEDRRRQLTEEIDKVARHLDSERQRLRAALAEMMSWIDGHLDRPSPFEAKQGEEGNGSLHGTSNGDTLSQRPLVGEPDNGSQPSAPAPGIH